MKQNSHVFIISAIIFLLFIATGINLTQPAATWYLTTVDSVGDVGNDSAIAVVNGQPAIAYFDDTNDDLKYARFNGTSWDITIVDDVSTYVEHMSLAEVNGQPAITYFDNDSFGLNYARFNGTDWDIDSVDTNGETGQYTSLAVVNGQPAISYYSDSYGDLLYARFNGTDWDITPVDTIGTVGAHTSLAVVGEQPAISYYDFTNGDLKYARFNGTSWDITPVDTVGGVGLHTSLAVVDGQPAISYITSADDVKYARFNGTDWDIAVVDTQGEPYQTSLKVVAGQPAIAYADLSGDSIKYASFNGTNWNIERLNQPGMPQRYPSLTMINGQPAISGYNTTDDDLMYMRLNRAPAAINDAYTIEQDTYLAVPAAGVLTNDSDADGDTMTARIVNNPAHGMLTLNANGSFIYVPQDGYAGTDSFTYLATDGMMNSNASTVTITVVADPTTTPDSYTTTQNTSINIPAASGVLANDNGSNGAPLMALRSSEPTHGLVRLEPSGAFSYTPDADFLGIDSFSYVASNGTATSAETTVTIQVSLPKICPPIAPLTDTSTALDEDAPPEAPAYLCTQPNRGRPTITWRNDPRADWYQVWIGGAEGAILYDWFPKDSDELPAGDHVPFGADAATYAQCEGLTCTLHPNINPTAGTYAVWMQAWGTPTNDTGDGHYAADGPLASAPAWNGGEHAEYSGFSLSSNPPGAIQPLTTTIASDGAVTLSWQAAEYATWYNIWIGTPEDFQQAFYGWTLAEHLGCELGGICTLTAGTEIIGADPFALALSAAGDYIYYVQSWGPGGYSVGGSDGAWQKSPIFIVE